MEWTLISSGPDINTGLASGSLDVGFMGIAPAIIGVSKDVGFRIFTTVSGQEHGLMTNDPDIHSLGDLTGSPDQIALANIGSIQHIILGLALEANGYDAHALDSNLAAMKHPDGMAALEAGSVSCNVTTSPYIFMERKNESLHELDEVKNVWSADRTYVVGVASEELYDTDPELYQALCKGISDSVDLMNSDMEAAAAITCAYDGNSPEDELEYLKAGKYFTSMKGVFELAEQMYAGQFIEKDFASFSELVFDNVTGD